jgi:hypothetical protein
MPRIVSLTPRFCARHKQLQLERDAEGALTRCIRALGKDELPTAQDAEAMSPPVAIYWFPRVPRCNLWIRFVFDDHRVSLLGITTTPPIPID